MIPPILEHQIWVAAPRDKTWQAITNSEHIKHWWGAEGYAEITELSAGASIKFNTGDGPIFPTIRVVDPPHQFVYEWPPHPRYFSVPFVTSYTLDEARSARFERISGEFRMVLENLKAYLEGRDLPHVF